MPQIQVLPGAPGFGSQLGSALGSGLSQGIGVGLSQMLEQKKTLKLLEGLGLGSQSQGSLSSRGLEPSQSAGLKNTSPEQILAVAMQNPQLGNVLSNLYSAEQKSFEKQRAFESERSTKYLDKVSDLATNLPERRIAIETAKSAINSGQMTPFGGDFVADILNLPQLRTSSGAQLATAAKTNLIGSLSQITGGRPNQFIEQQINNAFAKAGQSKEANLSQLDIIKAKLDIDSKLAELSDQYADQSRSQKGYVPESIDRDVRKAIKPYADQRMKELAYDLRANMENEMTRNELQKTVKVPNGTPLTLKKAKILVDKYGDKAEEVAIKLGYEIPDAEIYSRENK